MNLDALTEAEAADFRTIADVLKTKKPVQSERELWNFIRALTGHKIPYQPVCKDHVSPWDYIWQCYRVDLPNFAYNPKRKVTLGPPKRNIVYVGPRGGYKTISVGALIASELLTKDNCETVGMGAIQNHADRTYQLVQGYLKHPIVTDLGFVKRLLMKETKLTNGSNYAQVCGTLSGANALHPQKLRTEENDLMKEKVLEESRMMSSSWAGLNAQISYVSSRKHEDGIVDNLLENAIAKDFSLLVSCYRDSAEPCPVSRRGSKEVMYEVEDIYNPGKTLVANAYEGCKDCPLLPSCKGDLARAKGLVSIDDIISDWTTLERETWIWQKECRRTKPTNLYFPYWSEDLQVGVFRPSKQRCGWIDFSFDFSGGGDDPTVLGVWQTDEEDNDYLVGELVFPGGTLADDVAVAVYEWWDKWGRIPIRYQFGDSAAMQWIEELNAKTPKGQGGFFRIQPVKKIMRRDGLKLMRQRIRDNNGVRRLFVDGTCKLFVSEVGVARRAKNDPEDIAAKQSDHSLDQARYRLVELRYTGAIMANVRLITIPEEPRQVLPFNEDPGSKVLGPSEIFAPRYLRHFDDPEGD